MSAPSEAYVPSANVAVPDASPDRLAAVAALFGLDAVPPNRCRVLEVGCSEGAHLLPLAAQNPESTYVGVDSDPRAVSRGRERAESLGLSNLELRCARLESLLDGTDRFDYVVAHGLYSWIPAPARDALFRLLARVLRETGVAYVSFNALPGGYGRILLRELLLPQLEDVGDPKRRIARSREIAREIARGTEAHAASELLRSELEHFSRVSDSLVHHDYLAETHHALTVSEFSRHLGEHGLAYLTDSEALDLSPLGGHPLVSGLGSTLARLEYLDRLEMRRFRQALVCRKGAAQSEIDWQRATKLFVLSSAEVVSKGGSPNGAMKFRTLSGLELETAVPELNAALGELGRAWPEAIAFDELSRRVARATGVPIDGGALARKLFDSGAGAAARVVARSPRAARVAPERPLAAPTARLEIEAGRRVTNLHHAPVTVEPEFNRRLLALLDGTRDRSTLAKVLSDALEAGSLAVPGIDAGARARWEGAIPREVDAGISRLARYALLADGSSP